MEAAVLASFLNTLVPRIWEAQEKGAKAKAQLVYKIEDLKEELPLMAASIEDYESLGMDGKFRHRELIMKVRRLAQDMEDAIELFVYPSTYLLSYKDFEHKIEDLMYRLEGIKGDQKELEAAVAAPKTPVDQRIPDLPEIHEDETLAELLDLVKEFEGEPEGKLNVISIVGFSGLGKTLRANQLYRSKAVTLGFRRRAWVRAEDMDKNMLLKEIRKKLKDGANPSSELQQVTNGASPSNELQQVNNGANPSSVVQSDDKGGSLSDTEWIAKCVRETRCFIVIDDMRSKEQWMHISSAFPEEAKSMIVVTTTIQSVAEVCRFCSGGYVYKLQHLNRGMSIGLLLKKFRMEYSYFAEDLVNKCDGLPLALVALSEYLLGNGGLTRETCENVHRKLGAYLNGMEDKLPRMRRMLLGNYTGLSGPYGHVRKACLLYFSLFPFNHPSKRHSLIRRWVAEGFGSEDEAADHFKTLIDRNIIQAVEVSSNGVAKRCQPPVMMLEYISYKAMSENFVSLFHGQNTASRVTKDKVRRVSLNANSDNSWISRVDLPLVRTLEVSGEACRALLNFKEIKDKYDYVLLRVLDLKTCADLTDKDLEYICHRLKLLRYLSLGDNISVVPRAIENLGLLETLEMTRKRIVIVPFELIQLPLLQNLLGIFQLYEEEYDYIKKKRFLEMSKSGGRRPLYETSKLDRLSGFVAGQEGFPQLMPHMMCLKKVKIWCQSNADNFRKKKKTSANETLTKAIKAFIREGLDDSLGHRLLSVDFTGCSSPFQHSDSYPGRLTSLKLKGNLTGFPRFSELTGIEKLCLSSTNLSWALIKEGMTQFTSLIYLKLYEDDLDNLAQELEDPQKESSQDAPRNAGFQILKQICFSGRCGLPQPGVIQDLPVLTHVYLYSGAIQNEDATREWKKAAKEHPKRPTLSYGAPHLTETQSQ